MSPRKRRRSSAKANAGRRTWLAIIAVLVLVGVGWFSGGFSALEDLLGGDSGSERSDGGGGGGEVDADRARELLAELEVAEWGSTRDYSRDRFPHWSEEDGCDVRDRVLERDGEDVTVDEECEVSGGSWYSPFDGVTLTDPGDIDIDHTVPLANAWRTGASEWDDDRRAEFANDLERPQLMAVSASSNRSKGDQDPSEWQPQRDYWCQYAHDWVVVKHYWELWVTAEEKEALTDMLDTCG